MRPYIHQFMKDASKSSILAPSAAVTKFPNDSNPLDGGSRTSAQKNAPL
jgi:hypothetical protein